MKEVYEGKVSNGQKKDCEVREVQTDRTTMTYHSAPGPRLEN